jgi:hypothetical protein
MRRKEAAKLTGEKRASIRQIRLCVYQKVLWDPLVKTVIAKIAKKLTDEKRAANQQVCLMVQKTLFWDRFTHDDDDCQPSHTYSRKTKKEAHW